MCAWGRGTRLISLRNQTLGISPQFSRVWFRDYGVTSLPVAARETGASCKGYKASPQQTTCYIYIPQDRNQLCMGLTQLSLYDISFPGSTVTSEFQFRDLIL